MKCYTYNCTNEAIINGVCQDHALSGKKKRVRKEKPPKVVRVKVVKPVKHVIAYTGLWDATCKECGDVQIVREAKKTIPCPTCRGKLIFIGKIYE